MERQDEQRAIAGRPRPRRRERRDLRGDVRVREDDPLRLGRRAARVDDQRAAAGGDRRQIPRRRLEQVVRRAQPHVGRGRERRDGVGKPLARDERVGAGIAQDVVELRGRIGDRQRHGDAAGLPDAAQRGGKLDPGAISRATRAPLASPFGPASDEATRAAAAARSACVLTPRPSTMAGRSPCPSVGSVHAMSHLQQMRVGAEAANRHLPRGGGGNLEDQIELDGHDEPGRLGELAVELARVPSPRSRRARACVAAAGAP